MRFKLDENLGKREAELLKRAGYDTCTVPEQGLCSSSDKTLIQICSQESRCLVTLDLDFSNPIVFKPSQYSGIAVLRLRKNPRTELIALVQTLIHALSEDSIQGKLWVIEKGKIRKYQEKIS